MRAAKTIKTVSGLLLMLLLAAPALADTQTAKVTGVISGDEIVLEDGRHLSLSGIHAPLEATKGLADTAREKLQALAAGQLLTLENASTDRYGRIVADAYAGKMWLQSEILKAGLAFVYAPTGNARLADLLKAEGGARNKKRGIWADEFYADTDADNARDKEGQFAFVTGKVLKAARVKNMVYLNFGPDWHEDFTVTIAAHDLRAFRHVDIDPLTLEGKILRVRGWVRKTYRPEISVTDPGQITILN
jgi:endonuclease YncB( thermonuclease family)